jgi:surface antigen
LPACLTPYTGAAKARQIVLAALLAATSGLAGCASFHLPFGPQLSRVSMETTAAIPANGASIVSVDPSDWETVRTTIAAIPTGQAKTQEWANLKTRSTGSVSVAVAQDGRLIAVCRNFAATVSDAHGVRLYRGQACREITGRWQLKGVTGDDTVLS